MNRPVALVCYICGREFGTKSLAIHIKACEKKWENQQNLKPPKQRRPCPQPPRGMEEMLGKQKVTKQDINKYNAKSFDTFVEDALVQCQYCGRRFQPKSLIPHQKACKTSPMIKKPYVSKAAMSKAPQADLPIKSSSNNGYKQQIGKYEDSNEGGGNLVPCRRCGRKFNSDRVDKHQRVCKADPVQSDKQKNEAKFQKKPQVVSKMKPSFGKQKKAKWKIQHEQLQNAMKAMRQMNAVVAKGGKISDLPPPLPSNYDHYVECRYCGRKYAPDVAQRHIPKCANIINKPGGIKPSKIQEKYIAGTGSGSSKINSGSNFGNSNLGGAYGVSKVGAGYGQNPVSSKNNISTPHKPNFATSNSNSQMYGASSEIAKGGNYGPKVVNNGGKYNYTESKQQMPKGYGNSNAYGNIKSTAASQINNNYKPNLKSNNKSTSNKYW